ncbi:MAG TPA: hypothetical protein PK587_09840 [Syntrophales bacterium]|nr:hypothetical protein [Syntrophales bacterium]
MSKKRIFTVGFDLPGEEFEYVPFESDRSLLDADIVLFEVGFGQLSATEDYEGTPLFSKYNSPSVAQYLSHWRNELVAFVNAGKLAIIFVRKPRLYFRYTGNKTFSGTGRSQVTTNVVAPVSSYEGVPNITNAEGKSGKEVKLTAEGSFLAPYWKEFGPISEYQAFIEGNFTQKVLVTKTGEKTVGAVTRGKGTLLFLPPLSLDEKKFLTHEAKKGQTFWTKAALEFGKRLLKNLIALADAVKSKSKTPAPVWSQDPGYTTTEESQIQESIAKVTNEIARLQQKRTTLQEKLLEAGQLRGLLYETGQALEHAVREALILFGFSAKNYKESDSEFDVIFESPEGRLIGEVEGKDNKAISIEKLDQLERNLREDFAREEVTNFAKGVLFGNPERLTSPNERGESFTAKCMTAAGRSGIALIRTVDMYSPARYLRENADLGYAAECRKVILETSGSVVNFPPSPALEQLEKTEAETSSEPNPNGESKSRD